MTHLERRKMYPGLRIGRLVAVERVANDLTANGKRRKRWLFKCDCGNDYLAQSGTVLKNETKSCGCLRRERAAESARSGVLHEGRVRSGHGSASVAAKKGNALGQKRAHLFPQQYVTAIAVKRSKLCIDLPVRVFKPLVTAGRWDQHRRLCEAARG